MPTSDVPEKITRIGCRVVVGLVVGFALAVDTVSYYAHSVATFVVVIGLSVAACVILALGFGDQLLILPPIVAAHERPKRFYNALSFTIGQLCSAREIVLRGSLSKISCAFGLLFRYSFPLTIFPVSGSTSTFSPKEVPTAQNPPNCGRYLVGLFRKEFR